MRFVRRFYFCVTHFLTHFVFQDAVKDSFYQLPGLLEFAVYLVPVDPEGVHGFAVPYNELEQLRWYG